jgi:hypothetical protein
MLIINRYNINIDGLYAVITVCVKTTWRVCGNHMNGEHYTHAIRWFIYFNGAQKMHATPQFSSLC